MFDKERFVSIEQVKETLQFVGITKEEVEDELDECEFIETLEKIAIDNECYEGLKK